ncbi:MAG: hypothetical protein ASARMPREDX12_002052 [Alectoria sarmentosa]|nr:MAG: hypothetical protein ASARMPREDX12_002052 [Alectoria sarmentosa]
MTDRGALSSWNPTEGVFPLNDEAPKSRPRAWERAPKSPILARHHGRKVWKRYEAPQKAGSKDGPEEVEVIRQALGDASNTPRPVKRLRLKDVPKVENNGKESKAAQYSTTLLDQENAGTPKRKQASMKSLKPDNARVKTRSADDNKPRIFKESLNAVQNDTLHARESPALEEVRELLTSGDHAAETVEIAAISQPGQSDEVQKDETIPEIECVTSSETTTSDDQAISADEVSLEPETISLSEVVTIADESIIMEDDIASTQAVPEDADNMGSDAPSAADVPVPSTSRYEETLNAEGAITVESGSALSSSATHSPRVPEALQHDTDGVSSSPCKDSLKALTGMGLVFAQPNLHPSLTPSARVKTPKRASPRKNPKLLSPHAVTTPGAYRTPKLRLSTKSLHADYLCETPQIGTSLLRRESLRQKESPGKKKATRKSKTPKKRDTLQRRDTLQERQILQKVIAETNADRSDENLDARLIDISTLPSSSSALEADDNIGGNIHGSPEPGLDMGIVTGAEAVLPAVDDTNVEKDLHRAMEAIMVYEHPDLADASQPLLDETPDNDHGMEAMDKANEVLARIELEDVSQAMEATKEQTPNQKTRSGARFSDDTSMLKDFLNRAQARKAAQRPILSAPDAPIPQHSPRRSPRKPHGSQDGHASSPQKPRNVANRPGTPPGKPKAEALEFDDGEELTAEPASCRRSARTRLPAPSKAPPGGPSFIPVRRADGADPVVLQKSQAQELAVSTRANTRRNKGQSKPPLLALKDLPTESADLADTAKEGAEKAKSVAWAERLASYQDAKGEADDAEEKRRKVRRLRGLGAGNGTPAAKRRTAVVGTSNGTPAPKGRGKV